MKTNKIVLALVLLFLPIVLFASPSKIVNISYIPANPGYGDLVRITVNICASVYADPRLAIAISTQGAPQTAGAGGQIFVVDANGIDRKDVTFTNGGIQLGMDLGNTGGPAPVGQCLDCGTADGFPMTLVYDVHVPTADYFSGVCDPTSFYIVAGVKDFSLNAGDWSVLPASGCNGNASTLSVPIPIIVPPSSNKVTARYEGSLGAVGDEILFAMDYSYGGSGAFSISDPIPGAGDFTVVAFGPAMIPGGSVSGPAIGQTSGTYVWNFPSRAAKAGMQSGTVWMLLKLNTYTAGKNYTNTVTATQPGAVPNPNTAAASVVSGAPAISISKTENVSSLFQGQNITYVLSYGVNGYTLNNFQPFDNIATGVYNSGSGAPPGWRFMPYNGYAGTWTVSDPCLTGGSYITGSAPATTYPGLLLDDGSGADTSDQFCAGMITSDFYIEDSAYSGADAQIIVRSNGLTGTAGREIGVVASIDSAPAYLYISLCGGASPAPFCGTTGPAGSYTNTPNVGLISAKKWYRMRTVVTPGGSGQRVQAKVWARGDPEPGMWDIDYTIPNIGTASDWACDGSGTNNDWRPGINEQAGDGASVQDSYDNFTVYSPRVTSANTQVYDTVPTSVTYGGNSGGCTQAGGVVNCNIGSVSMQSGSFTWWGTANTCSSVISNQALIMYAANSPPIASNWVAADVLCWSPTFTATRTRTVTPTFSASTTATIGGPTGTFTRTITTGGTSTVTRTATPTVTITSGTATPTCFYAVVDDCNDGNQVNLMGGVWSAYDDSMNGGTSQVVPAMGQTFYMQGPGYGGTGFAARITGYVTTVYSYGFVGMDTGMNPNSVTPTYQTTDVSAYGSLMFYAKGDGKTYTLQLIANPSVYTMNDEYNYIFTAPASWTQVVIPFTAFTQTGWGNPQPRGTILANLTTLRFQTLGQPLASIELWVDDLQFNGCAVSTPTFTGTATVTPIQTIAPTCAGAAGAVWNAATTTAPFGKRHQNLSLVFNNKMWVISGADTVYPHYRDAWYSANGTDWYAATRNTAFMGRAYAAGVAFDDGTGEKMWLIGGNTNGTMMNDVWKSSDGAVWTQATSNAGFTPRTGMAACVYNGKIFAMAGGINGGPPYGHQNDVWSSSDGVNWASVTTNAAFSVRSAPGLVVFDNGTGSKMWIIGGAANNSDTRISDVWYSSDGKSWTLATANAGFSGRSNFACFVYNNEIYVAGGFNTSGRAGDVWKTSNGVNWTQVASAPGFGARDTTGLAFGGKGWVLAGWNSSDTQHDAWYTCGSASTPSITPTPTATKTFTVTWTQTRTMTFTCTVTRTITRTRTITPTPFCGNVGSDWFAATLNAAFSPRHEYAGVVYDAGAGPAMWMIGGGETNYPHKAEVWRSTNGADWTLVTGNAAFGQRASCAGLVYNNEMWCIAGQKNGSPLKDVWHSSNGADWYLATGNAAFGYRINAGAVVYNNRMWIIGGGDFVQNKNDVWWSTDGINWTQATAAAAFSPRCYPGAAVFDNGTGEKMWIVGGGPMYTATGYGDVWSSSDGANWTRATAALSPRMQCETLVYDNRLWAIGGINGSRLNDVLYTYDGSNWIQATASAAFSKRTNEAGYVYDGRMWFVGGWRDAGGTAREVWYTGCAGGTPTRTITPTGTVIVNTWTPTYTMTTGPTLMPSATRTFTPTPALCNFNLCDSIVIKLPGNNGGKNTCIDQNGNIITITLEWDDGCTCYVMVLYRFLPNGALDTSFGTGGRLKCPGPSSNYVWEDSMTVKCDASGNIVVAGYINGCGGTCADAVIYRFLPDGTPDLSFGSGPCGCNYRIFDNLAGGNGNDYFFDFDFDSLGRIVCTGRSWNGTGYDMIILRCNADGTPDTTFGPGGCRKFVSGGSCGKKITCHGGKIYVTGYVDEWDVSCSCTVRVIYIWCYLEDGTPDPSFGTGGCYKYYNISLNHKNCVPKSITITIEGKIVITGEVDDGTQGCSITCKRMIVIVLNSDGTPDNGFDGDGILVDSTGIGSSGVQVIIMNGKIVICGSIHNGKDTDGIVWKFNMDGSPDLSFGPGGKRIFDTGEEEDFLAILQVSLCRMVAAGYMANPEIGMGYDMVMWNIQDICPANTPSPTFTITATHTITKTSTPTITLTPVPTATPLAGNTLCLISDTSWKWFNPASGLTENVPVSGNYVNYANNIADVLYPIYPLAPDYANEYNWTDPAVIPVYKTFVIPDNYSLQGYQAHFEIMADDYANVEVNGHAIGCVAMPGGTSGWYEYYAGLGCTTVKGAPGYPPLAVDIADPTGSIFHKGVNTITAYVRGTDCCSSWLALSMCAEIYDAAIGYTPTFTPTITVTAIPPTGTFTATPTFTLTLTVTVTATITVTATSTDVSTDTATPTQTTTPTPPCASGTPQFTVHLVYNPEHLDYVVMEITSDVPLIAPPALVITAHGTCEKKPVFNVTATAEPLDTTGTRFRYLYPKQTGWGDIDKVVVTGSDTCGNAGTSSGDYTKETISKKDIILFKNVINPENGERCRIVFNAYENDNATVKIYSKNGALIKTLFDGPVAANTQHEVIWDGTNSSGQKVVSGMYIVAVDTDYYKATQKIAVVH